MADTIGTGLLLFGVFMCLCCLQSMKRIAKKQDRKQ